MQRLVSLFCILLTVFPAVGQSTSKYQVGAITEVKVHQTAVSGASDTASYDVFGLGGQHNLCGAMYATTGRGDREIRCGGCDLLASARGENEITYNDILGRSYEIPIGSQKPVARPVALQPKRKDKYLFERKLWIDVEDYSVVRIEGHPAKKLSFWIQRADFVRQYQKIDGFWLPRKNQTLVQVRLYGKKVLTIDHRDYVVNAGQSKDARAIVPGAAIALTSSR
jgi:hypothetical protein